MADRTKIEWTRGDDGSPGATWNPVTGCTRVSPGCENCYIDWAPPFRIEGRHFKTPCMHCDGDGFEPMGGRFKDSHACSVCGGDGEIRSHAIGSTTGVRLHPERLDQPIRWRKPRRIFVNSLSDLFHNDVPDDYIARVFAVMALAPQHTFQVLTKRHQRMRSLLNSEEFILTVQRAVRARAGEVDLLHGVLPNVWLGVTVEDQKRADLRIPALLDTPAAVRFLSCEPLLGPVDLRLGEYVDGGCRGCSGLLSPAHEPGNHWDPGEWSDIDWVICGGESGRGARPMHPDWARSLRDQCTSAGIAFHFKQWGEWVTEEQAPEDITLPGISWRHLGDHQPSVYKVGKKAAGRELDGRTWDEMPRAKS